MIIYLNCISGLRAEQLAGPFWAGWRNPPAPEDHLRILQGSHAVWLAIDTESGDMVGFINAVSDGVLTAYIPLLEVVAPYQGQGIGTELVRRMLATLGSLYQIDLMCDDDVRPFYERLGMQPAGGMVARNYARQSAAPLDRNK